MRTGLLVAGLALTVVAGAQVRFVGTTKYLNGARAVVTHTIDDSTKYVPAAVEAMDRYGVKATIFISTRRAPIEELWPVLRRAFQNGHEIGSHSQTHQCQWPGTPEWCRSAYTDAEIVGSRDDILRETGQPHVWAFCYPCGLCAGYDFVHRKLELAGYLVARNYPDEAAGGHSVPDLQTWDRAVYNAAYTQVVQKKGGIAPAGRTDVAEVNAKFDEVHRNGGIYNFLSHPQWLDYGAENFYERHLRHIGGRADVWYAPMGPLYAYRRAREQTRVRPSGANRFEVENGLSPRMYPTSVTLEFAAPTGWAPEGLPERAAGVTDRWDGEYYRRDGDKLYVTVRPKAVVTIRPIAR